MIAVTTKKIEAGRYAVAFNDRVSDLVIVKGPAPKFGMRQEWEVYKGDSSFPVAYGFQGLDDAKHALQTIKNA